MTSVLWRITEFDEIDSTNRWLLDRANDGESEGLVARADFQVAGRGRLTRTWVAPARSSLLTSILLRPPLDVADLHWATVAVALSARDALVRLCGLRPDLKWPNDLVVNDKKIGGILTELASNDEHGRGVVVGLGLNLSFPGPPEANGTCVLDEAGVRIEPRAALDLLLDELTVRVDLLTLEGRATLRDEYERALSTTGRQVRVDRVHDTVVGVASGVDESGRLIVETATTREVIDAGDVVHLRPSDQSP